jgi:hypothetical protein
VHAVNLFRRLTTIPAINMNERGVDVTSVGAVVPPYAEAVLPVKAKFKLTQKELYARRRTKRVMSNGDSRLACRGLQQLKFENHV